MIYLDFRTANLTGCRRHVAAGSVKISACFVHGKNRYKFVQLIRFSRNYNTNSSAVRKYFQMIDMKFWPENFTGCRTNADTGCVKSYFFLMKGNTRWKFVQVIIRRTTSKSPSKSIMAKQIKSSTSESIWRDGYAHVMSNRPAFYFLWEGICGLWKEIGGQVYAPGNFVKD